MVNVNCGACGHLNSRGYCSLTACIFPCGFGTGGYINKTVTNADRIRSMTDKDLAEWIYTHRWNDFDGLLDWLKEEAEA